MSKFGDFGGLPDNLFSKYFAVFSDQTKPNPQGLTAEQQRDVLAALGQEEHAALMATQATDLGQLVIQCMAVESEYRKITLGSTNVAPLITELQNLKNLYK